MPTSASAYETYVMATLAQHRTEFKSFRQEMLGNGQPGRIQRIESSVTSLGKDSETRFTDVGKTISGVNKRVWLFSGGLATLMFLLGLAAKFWPR